MSKLIKDVINTYIEENDLSMIEMAKLLGIDTPQQLDRWLSNPNETFSSRIERNFNELVELDEIF